MRDIEILADVKFFDRRAPYIKAKADLGLVIHSSLEVASISSPMFEGGSNKIYLAMLRTRFLVLSSWIYSTGDLPSMRASMRAPRRRIVINSKLLLRVA